VNFPARARFRWQLRTRTLALGERTRIMAIVNLTPDSFSGDGLSARGLESCVAAAVEAVDAGADIVDLGAESTRPGAEPLSAWLEQRRLLPVLERVLQARPEAVVSVDTYHASTALEAARAGAEIVNDVSGLLWDRDMAGAVAATRCGLVLMHTRGRPQEWQTQARLQPDQVADVVLSGLREQLAVAHAAGIARESIVLDPGFGFGKLGRENFVLLAELGRLQELGLAVIAGLSRKGFLGEAVKAVQPAGLDVQHARRTATIAANTAAVLAGAHILRVHEVRTAREAAAVADEVLRAARSPEREAPALP
jgi:dihydropteroate synthase